MNPKTLLLLVCISFFVSTAFLTPPTSSNNYYWIKTKDLMNQGLSYLFPPNLDFRGSNEEMAVAGEEAGAGEKVKEAVAKSLNKGKAAVEDSAKSAAQLAKNTLSPQNHPHEPEL